MRLAPFVHAIYFKFCKLVSDGLRSGTMSVKCEPLTVCDNVCLPCSPAFKQDDLLVKIFFHVVRPYLIFLPICGIVGASGRTHAYWLSLDRFGCSRYGLFTCLKLWRKYNPEFLSRSIRISLTIRLSDSVMLSCWFFSPCDFLLSKFTYPFFKAAWRFRLAWLYLISVMRITQYRKSAKK